MTLAQLFDAGLDKDSVGRRVEVGRLHRLHRGVYAVGHVRLDPAGVWLAGVLAAGEGAVLSHQSAASLWGLVGPLLLPVHVIAPTHRSSRPGLRIHRSRSLTEDQITTRNGIPVTTPLRTIEDLPPRLRPAARREAIVTRLIDRTPTDTPTRSNPERRFLRRIRALALPEPECNVGVEGRERDFVWRASRVVVEVDGPHHEDPDVRRFDRARDRELVAAGWTVLRYADDELDDLTELVALVG